MHRILTFRKSGNLKNKTKYSIGEHQYCPIEVFVLYHIISLPYRHIRLTHPLTKEQVSNFFGRLYTTNQQLLLEQQSSFHILDTAMDSDTVIIISMSSILAVLTLLTIIGNVFVIAAIILERNLRTTGNYLVLSLAVADLMVACSVMPIGAIFEIAGKWNLGTFLCDFWTSADVLCCTASILHLLAIALVSEIYCIHFPLPHPPLHQPTLPFPSTNDQFDQFEYNTTIDHYKYSLLFFCKTKTHQFCFQEMYSTQKTILKKLFCN